MDAEYSREKIVKQHEQIVQLKNEIVFLHKRAHIYMFVALVGWAAFVIAVYKYGSGQ